MNCKCKDCQKRFIGCHSSCPDYLEYKAWLEKGRSQRALEADLNEYALNEHYTANKCYRQKFRCR